MKKKMRMRNIITKEVSLNAFADSLNGKIQRNENLSFNREKAEGYVLKFREDDEEKFEKEFYVKYPYFRFRGMPVDKETAFDIISKTDYKYYNNNKTESGRNIDLVNKWTRDKNTGIDFPHGWCHPDGTIGYNDHTTKYPDYVEVLKEVINIKLDFPFLEFMVAFS